MTIYIGVFTYSFTAIAISAVCLHITRHQNAPTGQRLPSATSLVLMEDEICD